MKKDIEWLKEEIEEDIKSWGGGNPDYFRGASDAYENVKDWLNQLDEPEVLSQEWIDENKSLINGRSTNPDGTEGDCYDAHYIHVLELQNLLVPKQELPVIPKFVADWMKENHEYNIYGALSAVDKEMHSQVHDWVFVKGGINDFTRAWLDGYTVEEEQKYVLKIGNLYLAEPLADMTSDIVRMTRDAEVAYRFTDRSSIDTHLEKFEGTKAVKVEELEECL